MFMDADSLKFGTQIQQTRLLENFSLGITNPDLNPVCLGPGGVARHFQT